MGLPPESSALALPSTGDLARMLSSALRAGGERSSVRAVLHRAANPYASSLPTEVVACRLEDGRELRVLCKYGVSFHHSSRGHRGGVCYEAGVYRNVLRPSRVTTPSFYGTFVDPAEGRRCLVIEYIDGAMRLNQAPSDKAMARVARWLGRFHAEAETRAALLHEEGVNRYGEEYYETWAARTVRLAHRVGRRYPWLPPLRDGFTDSIGLLLASAPTAVHGELYPHNTLLTTRDVYVVDWETAAVAAGEIDVAAITEGWPARAASEFELEYRRTRWGGGAPPGWQRALNVARLYWLFRWLGDRPEWTGHERSGKRFRALEELGRSMGLI